MSDTDKRGILRIAAAFLICGVLNALLYNLDFFDCISQLLCGAVVIMWAVSVSRRVTDRRLCRLLLLIATFCLLLLLLQMVNYSFSQGQPDVRRWCRYAYQIPRMVIALLAFGLSDCICSGQAQKPGAFYLFLWGTGILQMVIALTNDFHFLMLRYPDGPQYYDRVELGFLYFVYVTSFGLLLAAAIFRILKAQRTEKIGTGWLLSTAPVLLFIAFLILEGLGKSPSVGGNRIWRTGETFCFCMIAFLEMLIDAGLIPANTAYGKLFSLAELSAVILDNDGNMKYRSAGLAYPFPQNGGIQVMRHAISGGQIVWAVDIAPLQAINSELEETARQISARNEYLSAEAKIKEEKTELETRNRIYDNITRIVRPQVDLITAMLDEPDRPFDEQLKTIAVFAAYIKRRSNMELLAENGSILFEELVLAVSESQLYLRLKGIRAAVSSSGSGLCPAGLIIAVYEQMEAVLEDCVDTLTDLMVFLRKAGPDITMRMMLKAASVTVPYAGTADVSHGCTKTMSVTKDGEDIILTYIFRKGGEAE